MGVENVDPIIATLIRATVASLMLMPIVGMNSNKMNWRIPPSRSILIVLIAGFFGMTIGALLYVTAVKLSGASTAAAITATAPVITIPMAVVFLDEKITSLIILGTILTVLGVLLLIL